MSQRPESDRSCYLEDIENDALLEFVEEQNAVSLATAITEVWTTPQTKQIAWTKVDTGVLCFVKDFTKRSYFFRLYSLDFCLVRKKPDQIWEHRLYLPFSYNQVTPYFHYFEQDASYVGLNFSFDDEADKFLRVIEAKVIDRSRRFYEQLQGGDLNYRSSLGNGDPISRLPRSISLKCDAYRSEQAQDYRKLTPNATAKPSTNKFSYTNLKTNGANYLNLFKSKMAKSFNKKPVIGKHEISLPRNPRHVQHIGVANNRLEVNLAMQEDSTRKMQEILQDLRLNIPVTKRTREFIDSFVQEHGGYEHFDDTLRHHRKLRSKNSVKVYPSPNEKPQAPVMRPKKPNAPPPPLPTVKTAMRPSPTSPELSRILSPPASPKSPNAHRTINFNDSNNLEQASSTDRGVPPPLNSTSISRCQTTLSPPPVPPPLPPNFSKIEVVSESKSSSDTSQSSSTPPMTTTKNKEEPKQPFISIISLSPPVSSGHTTSSPSPSSSSSSTSTSSNHTGHTTSGTSTSDKSSDTRQELLSSIQNFQGFSSTNKLRTPETHQPPVVSPMTADSNKLSLIDQLRMELLKRAQYLNCDSDDDEKDEPNESSDSEWC